MNRETGNRSGKATEKRTADNGKRDTIKAVYRMSTRSAVDTRLTTVLRQIRRQS